MNLLYHHRTQGRGVEAVHILSITRELRRLGHNVEIISPPGVNPERNDTGSHRWNKKKGIWKFLSSKSPEFLFELFEIAYNIYSYKKIWSILKKNNIHGIYERYSLFSISSYILARRFKKKIIYEVNDSAFLPRLRPLFFRTIARTIEKRVLSDANGVIVVSNVFKDRLVTNGITSDKITVLHNGIDPDRFNIEKVAGPPALSEKLTGKVVIGFTGLFVSWHRLDMLIRVFHNITKRHTHTHLLLVGDGPVTSDLEKDIEQLNLKENITITGIIPHSEMPAYISIMDISVIPAHESYTSPVKLFEYMAMAKPVVVPAIENIKEVAADLTDAVFFTPDDEDDLEKKIDMLIQDKEMRRMIGENARRKVLAHHTWEKNARVIEGMFLR